MIWVAGRTGFALNNSVNYAFILGDFLYLYFVLQYEVENKFSPFLESSPFHTAVPMHLSIPPFCTLAAPLTDERSFPHQSFAGLLLLLRITLSDHPANKL